MYNLQKVKIGYKVHLLNLNTYTKTIQQYVLYHI